MAIEKIPAWDKELIMERIGKLLDTPRMTRINLKLSASVASVPTLEYEIEEYPLPPSKGSCTWSERKL